MPFRKPLSHETDAKFTVIFLKTKKISWKYSRGDRLTSAYSECGRIPRKKHNNPHSVQRINWLWLRIYWKIVNFSYIRNSKCDNIHTKKRIFSEIFLEYQFGAKFADLIADYKVYSSSCRKNSPYMVRIRFSAINRCIPLTLTRTLK